MVRSRALSCPTVVFLGSRIVREFPLVYFTKNWITSVFSGCGIGAVGGICKEFSVVLYVVASVLRVGAVLPFGVGFRS